MGDDSSLEKLTEVDKLLKKLKYVSFKIGIKEDGEIAFDTRSIQDEFEKLRIELQFKINETDKFLDEKDKIGSTKDPGKTAEKYKLINKIEENISEIKKKFSDLKTILESQKKNKKKYEATIQNKVELSKLLDDRLNYLIHRNEGIVDPEDEEKNKYNIEKLDELLAKNAAKGGGEGPTSTNREIYAEEQAKINAWGEEVRQQDKGLEIISTNIGIIKKEAQKISQKQGDIGQKVTEIQKQANKTEKTLDKANKQIKDLIQKLGNDKICIDIILIVICLGLIAVLYNVIQSKLSNHSNSSSNSTSTNKTRLFY